MRARRTRGQALTEFLVIALVLIPLFLLLPTIGKYLDIAHATQMASRYVAFDAMQRNSSSDQGWKSPEQLAAEVRRRFFSNIDAPVKNGDTAGDFTANRNAFWYDSQGKPLISNFESDVSVSFGEDGQGTTHEAGMSSSKPDTWLFPVYADAMGLPDGGIYTANVTVRLANPDPLDGSYAHTYDLFSKLNLTMTRHTSLVVNSWGARDPGQVQDRIAKPLLVPGLLSIAPFEPVVDVGVGLMELPAAFPGGDFTKGPRFKELDNWKDVVPGDRLK